MAQADSVPTPIKALITGATSKASTNHRHMVDSEIEKPRAAKMAVGRQFVVLGYATAVLLLGSFPWNGLLILLLFLCRSDRGGAL
jgi:hypothetical protein